MAWGFTLNLPLNFRYLAIQEQALNNLSNSKQAAELPPQPLYASAPVQNRTGNARRPRSTDSDSLHPSAVPDINPTLPHHGEESGNEVGLTLTEELTLQSLCTGARPLPGAKFAQNWPEITPVTDPRPWSDRLPGRQ